MAPPGQHLRLLLRGMSRPGGRRREGGGNRPGPSPATLWSGPNPGRPGPVPDAARGDGGPRAQRGPAESLEPNPSARIERFGSVFLPGDKVMQTENDYDKDVFNGDLGTVV